MISQVERKHQITRVVANKPLYIPIYLFNTRTITLYSLSIYSILDARSLIASIHGSHHQINRDLSEHTNNMSNSTAFVELPTPEGLDIVSDMKLNNENLLVSTWDNRVLLYSCRPQAHQLTAEISTKSTPLSLFTGSHNTYVGSVNGAINEVDFENLKIYNDNLSSFDDDLSNGINNIRGINDQPNSLIASSFSGKLQMVDTRYRKSVLVNPNLNHKIHTMDTNDTKLVLGLSGNVIQIYDIRNINTPMETRELGLKFQISDLKCYPNQQGFAVATIDGRVSMEYFDSSPQFQALNRFTFKCHRSHDRASGNDIVHCVNSIAFHPTHGTLFTSGSDGGLCLWDVEKRKRMKMFPRFSDPIMKIACNDSIVAVATSDDKFTRMSKILSEDSQSAKPSKVYILHLSSTDCMPKKRN